MCARARVLYFARWKEDIINVWQTSLITTSIAVLQHVSSSAVDSKSVTVAQLHRYDNGTANISIKTVDS